MENQVEMMTSATDNTYAIGAPGHTYSYFPGCTLKTKGKDLDRYARLAADALGFALEELPQWQCCGAVYPMAKDEIATRLSSVRALESAGRMGNELVTLCSACHHVIKRVNLDMQNDADICDKVNRYLKLDMPYEGQTNVLHYLEVLRDRIGFDNLKAKVVKPLTGLKIGAYYGCLLLRPGKITLEELATVCPDVRIADAVTEQLKAGEKVLSPGMKYKHYAPKSPVYLIDGDSSSAVKYIAKRAESGSVAILCYESDIDTFRDAIPGAYIYEFGDADDELRQAHILFDILRDTDKHNFDEIYAPLPRKEGIGLALYNRMIRAAAYHIIRL